MNQLIAVALGGACGAVVRFLMSTGLYHWLGRGFPYGTLAVNIEGTYLTLSGLSCLLVISLGLLAGK